MASTSIIPILNGKGVLSHAKQIPWGTQQSMEYLLKLIQLKYSSFPTRVTSVQASWMLHNFCSFATNYPAVFHSLKIPANMCASSSSHLQSLSLKKRPKRNHPATCLIPQNSMLNDHPSAHHSKWQHHAPHL
ncbi:hypothetical protein BDR07DRAFT_1486362 [Suillus spraguei]|nr:hypothetical protein BDR07DRAFT_1486362 [Suillus spraguei]